MQINIYCSQHLQILSAPLYIYSTQTPHAKIPLALCLTLSLYSLVTLFASRGLIYLSVRHSLCSWFCGNEVTAAKSGHLCARLWHQTCIEQHLCIRCSELMITGKREKVVILSY